MGGLSWVCVLLARTAVTQGWDTLGRGDLMSCARSLLGHCWWQRTLGWSLFKRNARERVHLLGDREKKGSERSPSQGVLVFHF